MVSAPGPVVNEFRGDIYVAIGVIWQPTWRSVPAKRPECSMNTDGILRKSLFLTAILLVLIFGVGFMLPGDFKVERSIVIDAPPSEVYPWVGELRRWNQWDPWRHVDKELERSYKGNSAVGDHLEWKGPQSGTGRLTILSTEPNKSLRINMAEATLEHDRLIVFELEDLGGQTRLHWSISGENSMTPIGNYFALGLDRHLGNMYEQGLSNIISRTGELLESAKLGRRR